MGAKVLMLITVAMAMLGMVLGASHTVGAPAGSWDGEAAPVPVRDCIKLGHNSWH